MKQFKYLLFSSGALLTFMLLPFLGFSQTGYKEIKKKQNEASTSQGTINAKKAKASRSKGPKNNQATAESNKTNSAKNQKNMGKSQGTMNAKKANASNSNGPKNDQATAEANKGTNVQKKQRQMGTSTGDMVVSNKTGVKPPKYDNSVVVDDRPQRKQSKQMSKYQGDIVPAESNSHGPLNSGSTVIAREIDRKQEKQRAQYSGDLGNNFLAKRAKMRDEKNRQVSSYKGDLLVRTLNARAKRTRKKAKDIANYRGDLIVRKAKKGMHPSAVYQGGKVKNSYAAKEKYRKKMLKKYGKTEGLEDANWQKKENKKGGAPRYDSREAEIWNLKPKQ
ncbi:hypothetical protein [Cytophaga aurantiaca]|uniref:hypothetical protein n=1 Tax=Cytophaga aurantiaca TaxID=29530 RepID=UPI000367D290|nr:hypothetical protein [Cytophaga aurantiaca]